MTGLAPFAPDPKIGDESEGEAEYPPSPQQSQHDSQFAEWRRLAQPECPIAISAIAVKIRSLFMLQISVMDGRQEQVEAVGQATLQHDQ